MTRSQINGLLTELQDPDFTGDVSKLFSDPIDNIISLVVFPFDVKQSSTTWAGQTDESLLISIVETLTATGCFLGNLPMPIIDLGSKAITRTFNNFLDFAPYTSIELYLPFIGFVDLDVNVVMGRTINIKYVVDLHSGKCTAYVTYTENNTEVIVLVRDGQCGMTVQIAGGSGSEIARNLLRFGTGAVTGAASAAMGGTATGALGLVGSTAGSALEAGHIKIHKSGTTSPLTSAYAPTNCFLIYTRPVVAQPTSYGHTYGFPSGKTKTLSTLSGYTVVDKVHVEGSGFEHATRDEVDEISRLLKSGVIL